MKVGQQGGEVGVSGKEGRCVVKYRFRGWGDEEQEEGGDGGMGGIITALPNLVHTLLNSGGNSCFGA